MLENVKSGGRYTEEIKLDLLFGGSGSKSEMVSIVSKAVVVCDLSYCQLSCQSESVVYFF